MILPCLNKVSVTVTVLNMLMHENYRLFIVEQKIVHYVPSFWEGCPVSKGKTLLLGITITVGTTRYS